MLDQVDALFSLLDRFKRYWAKRNQPQREESIASRFLRLFAAHGIHRNQIPRFFGHGLQLRDVQGEAALIPWLTDAHLANACDIFGVERQWLERGEGNAHKRHSFYLQPLAYGQFLDRLLASKTLPNVEVSATLFGVLESRNLDSSLILSQPIGLLNDEVIYRYHTVDAGPLGYWKARVSAAALLAQAINRNIWVTGRLCNAKLLHELTYNEDLVSADGREELMTSSRRFEPEDWLLEPEVLLEGLDPERNRFGITSALELWSKFNTNGWMTIPYSQSDTSARFAAALKKAIE